MGNNRGKAHRGGLTTRDGGGQFSGNNHRGLVTARGAGASQSSGNDHGNEHHRLVTACCDSGYQPSCTIQLARQQLAE